MRLFTTLCVTPNRSPTSLSESSSKKIACINVCSPSDNKGRAAFSLSTITAQAVTPLRLMEILFLLCRYLSSTCRVQSPCVLIKIFLTGYPSIFEMICINRKYCLRAKEIPPNFKKRSRRVMKALQSNPPKHRFFNSVDLPCLTVTAYCIKLMLNIYINASAA